MNLTNRKVVVGRLFDRPFHPFLFAIFPMLSLLATNITEIRTTEAIRSLVISSIAAIFLVVSLNALFRDRYKSAIISTVFLILFFSYGHVYHFLETIQIAGIHLGRHRVLAPVYLLICGLAVWGIPRLKWDIPLLTRTLNIIAASAILLPLLQISTYYVLEKTAEPALSSQPSSLQVSEGQMLPDIYYIILDGYSRDDVLREYFKFDNSAFLEGLNDLGFYVSPCSLSNYAQTQLSLASALNLNYIDALEMGFDESRTNRIGMPGLIKHSAVRALLEEIGYTSVAFESGYYWTQVEDAGIYISPKSSAASLMDVTGGLNGFEALLVNNSAALVLVDGTTALPGFLQANLDHPRQIHRQRILFSLDQLERLPATPGPIFVFAHLVSPHKPFVFGPNGEAVDNYVDEIKAYRDQVAYLNSRMLPLLQSIITKSTPPPIIIVQGDHGGIETTGEQRMAILNAYYLPDGGDQLLHDHITPVNSFRLILNYYFGASYEELENVSYFSDYKNPYKYTPVKNSRPGCP
jgi:hypothetical protein